jgi:hypothetical protein
VADLALCIEEAQAGYPIAANDVWPIVFGGVIQVDTQAGSRQIQFERIPLDNRLLEEHFVLAWDPTEQPHRTSVILKQFVGNPKAPFFIQEISQLSGQAPQMIRLAVSEQIPTLC